MPDRYYSSTLIDGPTVVLDGSEAHHLLHVMRAKPGLELTVFDGQGGQFSAEVINCLRSTVEVSVGTRQDIECELPFELTLAVPLPKGDRSRWLVEKAVELGVTRIIPLKTTHSVNKYDANTKLTRYVIEASKQCCRNRLMEIAPLITWGKLLTDSTVSNRLLAHPGGISLANARTQPSSKTLIALGPEGGFADEEVTAGIKMGWQVIDLGSRILRIETAAVALVSALTIK